MLIKPIITEKSTRDAGLKIYTFKVGRGDTKSMIKKWVAETFGVKVLAVKTSTVAGKEYRTGRKWRKAYKPDWKKARVEIDKNQKIDLFEAESTEVAKK